MLKQKQLEWDAIGGSELRDTQGEILSIDGADITELEAGRGRLNDNHAKGFYNNIGKITHAKKIFKKEDCTDPRHEYYWNKIKAPYIYIRGVMYNDEDHPNARAAAAILRNVHRTDCPLKLKCSVEGGVISRGVKDPNLLARTKIHSLAATFTPANQATLMEPLNLEKSMDTWEADQILIKSVMHLAKTNVPSFRHVTRHAQAEKIVENFRKINELAKANGLTPIPEQTAEKWIEDALSEKISANINTINKLVKALTAGYGGAGSPTNMTGGSVIQSESLDGARGFKYFTCPQCGKEQIYATHQVKCRDCNKNLSLEQLYDIMVRKK